MTELYDVPYEIFMWREIFNCCLIVILTMFALYLIHKMRQKEEGSAQRNIYLGYSLFLIFYGLVRLFFIFSDCEVYNTHSSETFLNNIYVGMAYSFGIIGAICIFYMIERYLVHTRYIFTIIGIAILGLSFKQSTDDIRESPSIYVVDRLLREGSNISAYDPLAADNFRKLFPSIAYAPSAQDACKDADIVIFMTEWNEFREIDLAKLRKLMRGDILIDTRNIFLPGSARDAGFRYIGMGRN